MYRIGKTIRNITTSCGWVDRCTCLLCFTYDLHTCRQEERDALFSQSQVVASRDDGLIERERRLLERESKVKTSGSRLATELAEKEVTINQDVRGWVGMNR